MEVPCAGNKVDDGEPCYRRVTNPDYPYCMMQHDKRVSYCDPKIFRQAHLRDQVFELLRARDSNRDLYNPGKTLPDSSSCEVEHIGELQFAAFTCQFNTFQDTEERDDVVAFFRDEVLNELPNFYGRPDVRALDDIRVAAFNVPIVATFNDQLHDKGLSRKSTKAIRRETGRALQWSRDKFLNQGETPIYEDLGQLTQMLYTALDLHVVD
ncbi:hypothetical protein L914_14735 [Phytophthora nicotianae]|uniref:Uncharacterized protein n=2 Tax=Phytophthora nicotianae TaxID=4792 RepID=V9DTD2_PHYNI|nr:hypothetical protein F443_22716 [Phytophthora nicotianae P1569]ETM39072.1 hypothetical protein L914_14735 [Phytophthora nicotianae]